MAWAISITATGANGARLRDLWGVFEEFEATPSMAALAYPPHVTLAVYDSVSERQLRASLRAAFAGQPPLCLKFGRLAVFEQPELVVWAAPDASHPLRQAH